MNNEKTKKAVSQELVALSRSLGADSALILAGGGNTSYKDEQIIQVKASGSELGNITEEGFVLLSREKLKVIRSKKYSEDAKLREEEVKKDLLAARIAPELGQIPSVETYFHELINYPWVVHIHPWAVNALTCSKQGKSVYRKILGEDTLWIDFCPPGYTLSRIIESEIKKFAQIHKKHPQVILLENHGVIVGGESAEEVKNRIREVVDKVASHLSLPEEKKEEPRIKLDEVSLWIRRALGEKRRRIIFSLRCLEIPEEIVKGAFTPDQIVYCGPKAIWMEGEHITPEKLIAKIRHCLEKEEYEAKIIAVNGVGIFGIGESWKTAKNAALIFRDIIKIYRASFSFGGPKFLPSKYVKFIDNWEVERYRRRIAEGKRGEIAGRIAIVTGGAQGVGRGIAEGLLKEGAHVVIADINYEMAEKVARKFEESFGEGRAVPCQVDVTREDDVQDMVAFTVKRFGGIDILISNAGILIADNILSFPYDKFRKVIEVNFYGYFLCAQKAARVMVEQGYGDIIQINSKSGKKGSKANSAYASSKFAGIGFTQSIAMDLAAHNIFVNAICPGNFLDLELWQREGGLLDQYLKAGKVPGAKTRKDVENYYKNLTLLKRASTIEDVMHTIFYILKQRGETGQAYNVSQGQEMR